MCINDVRHCINFLAKESKKKLTINNMVISREGKQKVQRFENHPLNYIASYLKFSK